MICELCNRETDKLFKHHIIPKIKGGSKGDILLCCLNCSQQVHMLFTEHELATMSIEILKSTPQMRKYLKWIRKRKGNFAMRQSNRIKKR